MVACGGSGDGRATHYVVADCGRRLIFLGAGELELEWLVGLIMVCGKDLRGEALDCRLADDLRMLELLHVRVLKKQGVKRAGRGNGRARAKKAAEWRAQQAAASRA